MLLDLGLGAGCASGERALERREKLLASRAVVTRTRVGMFVPRYSDGKLRVVRAVRSITFFTAARPAFTAAPPRPTKEKGSLYPVAR